MSLNCKCSGFKAETNIWSSLKCTFIPIDRVAAGNIKLLYILLQSEDSIVYKDIWDFSRRWIVFEKKNIKTGLSSFLLVDSNGDLLSGRPFFKLENISSLQSLPPDFKISLLPIMNDPGTDSIRKNLVLDTLAKTLTIDQEQSEPDKRPDDDIWKSIDLENVEIKAFKKDKQYI